MFKKDKDDPLKSLQLGIYRPINEGDRFLVKTNFEIIQVSKKINIVKDNILKVENNLNILQLYIIEINNKKQYINMPVNHSFFDKYSNFLERL